MKKTLLLFLIVAFSFILRADGFNWDQGQHLHPDERFLTMVGTQIHWPDSVGEYFDTNKSPLSPYNNNYDFFVYGTFPLFLTKAVAGMIGFGNYGHFNLVGRLLSAIFDTGVVILLWFISGGVLASLVYALMVLPIQLSHFFTVDTFLNFFLVLTFYSAFTWPAIATGFFLGLALSCKISAILFLPIVGLLFLFRFRLKPKKLFINAGFLLLAAFISFRIFNPYAFRGLLVPNPQFIKSIKTLQSFNNPAANFPPAVQWIKTKPIIFPALNLFFWGLGAPLGILVVMSLAWLLIKQVTIFKKGLFSKKERLYTVALFWVFFLFLFQGVQFVKTMRYFLPIYPFLALITAKFLQKSFINRWFAYKKLRLVIFVPLFLYPLAFTSIYRRSHSRVTASRWIYENIPSGSVISCEHWDDCLPLPVRNKNSLIYQTELMPLYNKDNQEKWRRVNQQLERIDYLIISSNRLSGSIPKVPEKYPQTAVYYQRLFSGQLGFKKVAEFTSYPSLGVFGYRWTIKDDGAEEAFTVFDHPKVVIFQKEKKVAPQRDF